MNPRINGRPNSFRHYRLTLQLVLSPLLSISFFLSLSFYVYHDPDTRSRTPVCTSNILFTCQRFQFVASLTRTGDGHYERIDRGLFAESLRAEPRGGRIRLSLNIRCNTECAHSPTICHRSHDIACTSFTLHKRVVIIQNTRFSQLCRECGQPESSRDG